MNYLNKVKCGFCREIALVQNGAGPLDWTWFTGLLRETVYVCKACQVERRAEVLAKMAKAGVRE